MAKRSTQSKPKLRTSPKKNVGATPGKKKPVLRARPVAKKSSSPKKNIRAKNNIKNAPKKKSTTTSKKTLSKRRRIQNPKSKIQNSHHVVIVGAGKVAHAFAALFEEMGWKIDGVVAHSTASASLLARQSGAKVMKLGTSPLSADVVLLAVSDSAVRSVGEQLYPLMSKGSVLLFTGGSTSKKDFPMLTARGVHVIGIHPIQTFTDKKYSSERLKNITFGLEATKEEEKIVEPILRATNGRALPVSSDMKVLYHAAIVMAANLYVGLWSRMETAFAKVNGTTQSIRQALAPLVRQTVENVLSAKDSLPFSGPVSRADAKTVAEHRKALKPLAKAEKLYTILSRELVRIGMSQKKFTRKQVKRLKKALK